MAALGGQQLGFFAPRFLSYRAAIHRKYIFLHGFVDPKFINTALFSDGTQRQHNRDRRTNFSGHKHFYCYGYLNTVAPDGMIVDISGAFAGRKNDHMKQNESHLSDRLVDCQVGNAIQCNTMTDKGLYLVILNTLSFIRCLTCRLSSPTMHCSRVQQCFQYACSKLL